MGILELNIVNPASDFEHSLNVFPDYLTNQIDRVVANKTNEKIELFIKAFILNMSHEIRTPLNSIVGYSSLICNNVLSADEIKKYKNEVQLSSNTLIKTIENVLDFSLIETNNYTLFFNFFNLAELIEELYVNLKKTNKNNEVATLLKLPDELTMFELYTDKQVVFKIINQFLSNALKFTKCGKIVISAFLTGKKLAIKVSDTGMGINNNELNSIFEPFNKSIDGNTLYRGLGLGLALSKKLCMLINAEIIVKSKQEKGTSFCLILPV